MSEIALYRKYRPQAFNEVVGQDHVLQILQGSLKQKNIAHAYLFAGSRGTGKTSVARIFAREIGVSANDLYEIDAASNRGIDDIRAIRDAVNAQPFESPYKVYIVDEVHMLTKEAFNALLKTLEEPPKHAIFILATTELDKLPETIISRCQVFTFKKPTIKILKDVVLNTAKAEGYTLEGASAELIALLGDGSFRDTMGMLQKVLSSGTGKKISHAEVEHITGAPRSALINDVVHAIAYTEIEKGLQTIAQAVEANIDLKVFLGMTLERVRAVLLMRFAPALATSLKDELSETDFAFVEKLAKDKSAVLSSNTIIALIQAADLMKTATVTQLPLELVLINLARLEK
jgi:DNA polymerase-3 subunit gamma/tau